jgi:hypothetical protein
MQSTQNCKTKGHAQSSLKNKNEKQKKLNEIIKVTPGINEIVTL